MNEITVRLGLVLSDHLFDDESNERQGFKSNIERNRLICFINNQNFRHLFTSNDSIIGSIVCYNNSIKQINCSSNSLFICIKTIENDLLNDEGLDSVKLMVSQQFMAHYCLSPEDKSLFLTFVSNCPKLSEVTIGVKDKQLYQSMSDENWSKTLWSLVSENKTKLLCRKYDIFCANNDLIVLNCKPVLQGIISLETELVMIDISQSVQQNEELENELSEQKSSNDSDNRVVNVLNLMNFTSRLLMSPSIANRFDGSPPNLRSNDITAIKTLTASSNFLNSMSFTFKIIILSNSPSISEVDSENGCVFVTRNTLINKLKSEPKDWVRIWLSSDDKTLKSNQRFSQIFAIDSITDDNIAYISPQLWFNLQTLSADPFSNRPLLQSNITLMIRKDILLKDRMKYCSCVHLSLIHSPEVSANIDFSEVLKSYFSKSRYIVKNDVIGIWGRNDGTYLSKCNEISKNEWPVIYFRVSLVEGNGCLVDVNHSKLYQSGTTHCLIPASLPSYYNPNDWLSLDTSPVLLGLSSSVDVLCQIIEPYLMPKSKIIGTVMISGPSSSGKKSVVRLMCRHWNLNLYEISTNDMIGETLTQTETRIKLSLSKASIYAPTVVLISDINAFSNTELYDESRIANTFGQSLFDLIETSQEWPLIVISTNSEPKKFANNELNSVFIHSMEMECPNLEEREELLKALIGQVPISDDITFGDFAQKTAGFYLGDLKALVSKAIQYVFEYFADSYIESDLRGIALSGAVLTNKHIIKALNELQKLHFDSIGSSNIPNVEWNDIGGHELIKSEILDTIQLPLECPQLISLGFKRSGVLLYGPPGTGKTLLAKAAANQCSLNFLSVKGPELINMFVGQSEENVRNLFSRARKCGPAVIFFDELDSLAPNRGHSGDSGGVMDRVVSQLLAEMDGINKANDVFVIGATNRPDLLDSALLRPGRFDRLLYVGIAEDSKSRLHILKALTRKFQFDSDVDLEQIENCCPPGLSGADFYSICSNALFNAIQRNIQLLDKKLIDEDFSQIIVRMSDFVSVLPQFSEN